MSMPSDIVVSGTGIMTSLGRGRAAVFDAIHAGRVGLGAMPALEQRPDPDLGGGQAVDVEKNEPDRASAYLRVVIQDALGEAGIEPGDGRRIAVVLGSTLHGMRAAGRYLRSGRVEEMGGFLAGSVLERAIDGLGLGPIRMTTCAACSSGLSSVGLGMTLLRSGVADVVVAGGYDTVSEYAYAGFNSLRLVSPEWLRPFGEDRVGMKVAEGYGALVLERAEDADGRAIAVVRGYGESSDSFHLTQPRPDGLGAAAAIADALRESGMEADQIGLISAHATGTPHNDAAEYQAMQHAFGGRLAETPVVGLKGSLGHTLGGAGAVELILSLESMARRCVLPTPGANRADPDFTELRMAAEPIEKCNIGATLNLSLGFGGSNTAVVLGGSGGPKRSEAGNEPSEIVPVITGIGVVLPGVVGFEALCRAVRSGERITASQIAGADYASLLTARRLRRVSEYAKLSLAAATDACGHGSFDPSEGEECSAILGTAHGSAAYCEQYYTQIVEEGMSAANPVFFAEGVPNAAAAHLSMGLGLRGGCQTIIGSRTAGLEGLLLAGLRIREGRVSRCIVAAAEEYSEFAKKSHERCGSRVGVGASAGAVAFVVESRADAEARGAVIYAALGDSGWGVGRESHSYLWENALKSPEIAWLDLPGDPQGDHTEFGDRVRSVVELFPEMYSVSSLLAVAASLMEPGCQVGVVSGDFSERVCGMGFHVES